jgi:hypothetical protein
MNLPDGTYYLDADGEVNNYGNRWGYGYIVAVRNLRMVDLNSPSLFRVRTDFDGGAVYELVRHASTLRDAWQMGQLYGQRTAWSLADRKDVIL